MSGGGGEAGESGTNGSRELIDAACRDACQSRTLSCAPPSTCVDDCTEGHRRLPPDCVLHASNYLRCIGSPDVCLDPGGGPQYCLTSHLLVECLVPNFRALCSDVTIAYALDACTLAKTCDGVATSVTCDAQDDGSGTSLCDCHRSGALVDSQPFQATGILACAEAFERCSEP